MRSNILLAGAAALLLSTVAGASFAQVNTGALKSASETKDPTKADVKDAKVEAKGAEKAASTAKHKAKVASHKAKVAADKADDAAKAAQ